MPDCITIIGKRVERLQDISEADCLKEGVTRLEDGLFSDGFTKIQYPTAQEAFRHIAETAMDRNIWERNPYVYVYEFIRTDGIPTVLLSEPAARELIDKARSNDIVQLLKKQEEMTVIREL
jgi:hypothetical protein